MNFFPLRAGLAVAFIFWGGLASAAPTPVLDQDPAGFLRYVDSSPSPEARTARREISAGPAALARERALAQKEGVAVFPAQLNRLLPPDDQNAAPLYLKYFQMRRDKPIYSETVSAYYAYTPAHLARIQKVYDDNPEVFSVLRQATDRPQCVFARDWTQDTSRAAFQNLVNLRWAAWELASEGVLKADQGHYAEAIIVEERVYRLAEHAASDPTVFNYQVAQDIDGSATNGMRDILTLAGPNAKIDALVGQAMTDKVAHLSLRHALSGEAAACGARFAVLRRDGPGALAGLFSNGGSAPRPIETDFTTQERHFYADLLDAAEADYIHQMRPVIRAMGTSGEAAALAQAMRETQSPEGDLVRGVFRRLSPFPFVLPNAQPVRLVASHSFTRAAAAVLALRAKTGTFPATLPGASPDPYTGRPLGYRREGSDGFVIYTTGKDGKYDGGRPGDATLDVNVWSGFRYPVVPVPVPLEELK